MSNPRCSIVLTVVFVTAVMLVTPSTAVRCDRTPEVKSHGQSKLENKFEIQISRNPDTYVPGEQYTVNLRGRMDRFTQYKFKDFLLVIEQEHVDSRQEILQKPSVGSFTLFGDALTRYSDKCPNAVQQTNSLPKREIQVLWKAPEAGSGCVAFRATVVEERDRWYMDEGNLSKILCEEVTESEDMQPPILQKCCACEEAKYETKVYAFGIEPRQIISMKVGRCFVRHSKRRQGHESKFVHLCRVLDDYFSYRTLGTILTPVLKIFLAMVTFEGLWSRNTHPKNFPENNWITKFSDVIGASHTRNYTFWNYGELASDGLRQVAEQGNTRMLESELKRKSDHIRTIIKARGISYPNVTGKTFAVFRVDSQHHLMSLVSMIAPSPDWFVGVSSLELCLGNCSWIESKILNLYPNDAGTDDGWTYLSDDKPTTPRNPIRRIRSDSPNDPRSPFYDPTGAEMKPLARLYLSRQRLYEKPCEDLHGEDTDGGKPDCKVTEWSEWSPCSATCGRGTKYRQRKYVKESSRYECTRHLTTRGSCEAPLSVCPDHSQDKFNDPLCALTDWSEWSSCSVSCGRGSRTRDRRYHTRNATKHCTVGLQNRPKLQETEMCIGHYGACYNEPLDTSKENISMDCRTRPWSLWTPCSATCGRGYKIRTREPVNSIEHESDTTIEEDGEDPCDDERTKEIVECEIQTCDNLGTSEDICRMPKDIGPCRANMERWFFDIVKAKCDTFSYTGCQGNRNNFESEEYCEKVCGKFKKELIANRTAQKKQMGVSVSGVLSYNLQMQDDANIGADCVTTDPITSMQIGGLIVDSQITEDKSVTHQATGPVVNCKMTKWSPWTPCDVAGECGKGRRQKHRDIKIHPMNGGKPCSKKLFKSQQCRIPCNRRRNELDPSWGSPSLTEKQDCEMSDWSPWSPCSLTCGLKSVRKRTRQILREPTAGGKPCGSRVDTKICHVPPCYSYSLS